MEKPTLKQRADALVTFLWDSENSKVLGRGGRSWVEIGLFYLIYYACLASFFAATMAVFYQTIPDDQPKLLKDSSLLDGNPGLGFRPMPEVDDTGITAHMSSKNTKNVNDIKAFLEPYSDISMKSADCGIDDGPRPGEPLPCKFDITAEMDDACGEKNEYGAKDGAPCVLIKLNKVYGWMPSLWDSVTDAGDSLPDDVKATYTKNVVPISCYTKEKSDMDDLGTLNYFPQQGFATHFFPYEKQKNYRAPFVFVQFGNGTAKNTRFEMECRVYARNIEYDRSEIQGSVQFDLKIVD